MREMQSNYETRLTEIKREAERKWEKEIAEIREKEVQKMVHKIKEGVQKLQGAGPSPRIPEINVAPDDDPEIFEEALRRYKEEKKI